MDRTILEHYVDYFNKQEGSSYPCSNQIVVCGIITKDRDKALSVMKNRGAVISRQSNVSNYIEWELNNERWLWRSWNDGARGYRFYKILVDKNIDEELFRFVRVKSSAYCCSMEII